MLNRFHPVADSYKSLQDAVYGPFALGGLWTPSRDTLMHWRLERREGPLARGREEGSLGG